MIDGIATNCPHKERRIERGATTNSTARIFLADESDDSVLASIQNEAALLDLRPAVKMLWSLPQFLLAMIS